MDDLVLLRELIRTPGSTCFPLSINRVFLNLGMEALLECVITRASPPCNPIAVALPLNLLGLKSISACVRAANSVDSFTRRYTRDLNTLIRLDVGPEAFARFRGRMDRTYVLACQTSASLSVPDRGRDEARATRPVSMIKHSNGNRKRFPSHRNPRRYHVRYASGRILRHNLL